jgi:hypothetical protein
MNSRVKASYFPKYTDWLNYLQWHQFHLFPSPRSEREIPRSRGKGRAGACIPGGGASGPDEEPPLVGLGLRSLQTVPSPSTSDLLPIYRLDAVPTGHKNAWAQYTGEGRKCGGRK